MIYSLSDEQKRILIGKALEVMHFAYAPYSNFKVGAALLCADGSIYTGINIENAAYSPTNCAERTAFFKAISEGKRRFRAIAVCGGMGAKIEKYTFPCGVCRQVMREFCDPESFLIYIVKTEDDYKVFKLSELLPESFGPDDLSL